MAEEVLVGTCTDLLCTTHSHCSSNHRECLLHMPGQSTMVKGALGLHSALLVTLSIKCVCVWGGGGGELCSAAQVHTRASRPVAVGARGGDLCLAAQVRTRATSARPPRARAGASSSRPHKRAHGRAPPGRCGRARGRAPPGCIGTQSARLRRRKANTG
jgi:hypothetical protein